MQSQNSDLLYQHATTDPSGEGNPGYIVSPWLDCKEADLASFTARWGTAWAFDGTLWGCNRVERPSNGEFDDPDTGPLVIPAGALHPWNAAITLNADGEIEVTSVADTGFHLNVSDIGVRWLQLRFLWDSGGAAAGANGLFLHHRITFPE